MATMRQVATSKPRERSFAEDEKTFIAKDTHIFRKASVYKEEKDTKVSKSIQYEDPDPEATFDLRESERK